MTNPDGDTDTSAQAINRAPTPSMQNKVWECLGHRQIRTQTVRNLATKRLAEWATEDLQTFKELNELNRILINLEVHGQKHNIDHKTENTNLTQDWWLFPVLHVTYNRVS